MTPSEQAIKFHQEAAKCGFHWEIVSDSVIRIRKRFSSGDKVAFCQADSEAYDVLSHAPLKGGSIWGTDGGSIGGHVGLTNGEYVLNKSGESGKRFVAALRKLYGK